MPNQVKPPSPEERAWLKSQGYTDERIDRDFGIAAQPQKKEAETWSPRGKTLSGARELAQGLTFGFGDEIEAGLGAMLPGRNYADEAARVRGEMREFKEAYPKTAFGLNIAGGAMLPIPGAATRSLGKTAITSALEGAASAFGSAEGGLKERAVAAGFGGAGGAVMGPVMSRVASGVTSRAMRLGKGADADVQSVSRRALQAGYKTPAEIEQAAIAMTNDVPDARVVDVLGVPGARRARTIRSYGGEAGNVVDTKVGERIGENQKSMQSLLTRVTGLSRENALNTLDQSIKRGKDESAPLYQAFYDSQPKESSLIDEILQTDFGRMVMARAKSNASNERRKFIDPAQPAAATGMLDQFGNPMMSAAKPAKHHPQSLDDIKKAMDDLIYESKFPGVQAGQGGIKPGELRAVSKLRKEFVDEVDALYPETYAKARSEWAGEKAIRDAFTTGQKLAAKKVDPREIAEEVADLDPAALGYFRRGHLDGLRQMVDDGRKLPVGNTAFRDRIEAIYGDQADQVLRSLKIKDQMARRDNFIVGGSQTKDKDLDALEDAAEASKVAQIADLLTAPRTAAIRGLGAIERAVISPRFDARRLQEANALMSEASGIGPLISRMEREMGVQRRAGKTAGRAASTTAKTTGLGLGRFFVPPQE